MGRNDHIGWYLHEQVQQAVEAGLIEVSSRGYWISQRVIHRGFDSLCPKQRSIYNREILPALNEMAWRQYIRERWFKAAGVSAGHPEGTKDSVPAPQGSPGHRA
jgi:hypothetical protein